MTVGRVYRMIAAEGQGDALAGALADLRELVLTQPGCTGVDLLRDDADGNRFLFIEKWDSVAAHQLCLGSLPKEALGGVMGALAGPPEGSYETYL